MSVAAGEPGRRLPRNAARRPLGLVVSPTGLADGLAHDMRYQAAVPGFAPELRFPRSAPPESGFGRLMNARQYTPRARRDPTPRYPAHRRAPPRGLSMPMKTYVATPTDRERNWLLVDAEGQTLGRLATQIADALRGKRKPTYTPHIDTGDFVVVVNAEKISVTGDKRAEKMLLPPLGLPGRPEVAHAQRHARAPARRGHPPRRARACCPATASAASSSPSSRSTRAPSIRTRPSSRNRWRSRPDGRGEPTARGRAPRRPRSRSSRRGDPDRRGDRREEPPARRGRRRAEERPAAEEAPRRGAARGRGGSPAEEAVAEARRGRRADDDEDDEEHAPRVKPADPRRRPRGRHRPRGRGGPARRVALRARTTRTSESSPTAPTRTRPPSRSPTRRSTSPPARATARPASARPPSRA